MANKRVTELTEKTILDSSDYLIVDSAAGGTKKLQISTLIAAISGLAIAIVNELPTIDIDTHTLYLVPKTNPESPDVYNEYMYINNAWELIGSTEVSLTNYYTKTEVDDALADKQDELTFDATPTASSTNPVTSGGVKAALDGKEDTLTFDSTPTASSSNPVTSGGVKTALDAKQDTLTIDAALSGTSENPVQNKVVKAALDNIYTKAEVDTIVNAIKALDIEVVATLPTTDISTTTIYLVPKSQSQTQNVYDEYLYINNAWELIGSTAIDLSNYYNKTQTDNLLAGKEDTLTFDATPTASSDNPVTSGGVKAALDQKQDTLTIDAALSGTSENPVQNKAVKAALDGKQGALTAGDNITIDSNNKISASSAGTKYTKTVDLAKTDSRTIAFNPTGYSYAATDRIDVYINGLHGIQGTDYTLSVSGTSLNVVLTLAGTTGVTEKIEIVAIK